VVKLLLDTHVLLWWVRDDRRMGKDARRAIATADLVWVSAVSGWEASLKVAKGRLRLPEPMAVTLAADDFMELPITLRHVGELERLPRHHDDPANRLLVAQARVEGATIVTHGRAIGNYDVRVIWT
jgi:PIN domain nuclease of toxin-antitoxin system